MKTTKNAKKKAKMNHVTKNMHHTKNHSQPQLTLTKKNKIPPKNNRNKKSNLTNKNNDDHSPQKITFTLERFASGSPIPTRQSFQVTAEKGDTILDCLDEIREKQDPSLSYRRNCRNTICGSCAMTINGKARLACKEHALELIKGKKEIIVAPMRNMPVIKDFITDMKNFWNHLKAVNPWVETGNKKLPEKEFAMTPEQHAELKQAGDCIMCGACYAASSGIEGELQFLGPAALARAYRLIADPRDAKTKERLQQADIKHGTWDCTHCFYCNEVCPVNVDPMDQILKIRKMNMDKGSTKTHGARHHLAFYDIIKKTGILNENKLPLKSVGIFNVAGILQLTPVGLRMMKSGKMPPLLHHSIPNVKEVKEIFTIIENMTPEQRKIKKKLGPMVLGSG